MLRVGEQIQIDGILHASTPIPPGREQV
jgi:hypothetical protein